MKPTQEQVIAWAREADLLTTTEPNGYQVSIPENLEAFANLVAAAEREACAELIPPQYFELGDLIRARREQ